MQTEALRVTLADLRAALDVCDREPGFREFAPKKYIVPGGYTNPRHFGIMHFEGLIAQGRGMPLNVTQKISVNLGNALQKLNYPAYFVAPDLIRMALATSPPKEIALAKLKWPLAAIEFIYPGETVQEELGTAFNYGIIGRVWQGPPISGEQIMTITECIEPAGHLSWYHSHIPLDNHDYKIGDITGDNLMGEVDPKTAAAGGFDHDRDLRLGNAATGLLYNLLLIMQACPGLIEQGECVRKARPEKKPGEGGKLELWSANFFGRQYRIKGAEIERKGAPERPEGAGGGTHASPRTHWRRGHFRTQRHGPELREVRVLWIEPVLVNAPEPAPPAPAETGQLLK